MVIAAVVVAYVLYLSQNVPPKPPPNPPPGSKALPPATPTNVLPLPAVVPTAPATKPVVITPTAPAATPTGAVKPPAVQQTVPAIKPVVKPPVKPLPKFTGSAIEADTPEAKAYKIETEDAKKEREALAQEALKEAKAYEADTNADRNKVRQFYEESVINNYPGTEAAKEAQKAVERLIKEMDGTAPTP